MNEVDLIPLLGIEKELHDIMVDEVLRHLEREARDDPVTEGRYLRERLRAGTLKLDQVLLLVRVEYPAALIALGREVVEEDNVEPVSMWEWTLELQPWGKEALVLAAVVSAELALPVWEKIAPKDVKPRQALAAAITWRDCPCDAHAEKALAIARKQSPSRNRGPGLTGIQAAWAAGSPSTQAVRFAAAAVANAATVIEAAKLKGAIRDEIVRSILS